jgi:hypothetical protein
MRGTNWMVGALLALASCQLGEDVYEGAGCDPKTLSCPPGYACDLTRNVCAARSSLCAVANGGCDPHASCLEAFTYASCACQPGYVGDGFTCASDETRVTLLVTSTAGASTTTQSVALGPWAVEYRLVTPAGIEPVVRLQVSFEPPVQFVIIDGKQVGGFASPAEVRLDPGPVVALVRVLTFSNAVTTYRVTLARGP